MKHKDKVKLAKEIQTTYERKMGVPLFMTLSWLKRSEAKRIKELEKKYGDDVKKHIDPTFVKIKGSSPVKIEFKSNSEINV